MEEIQMKKLLACSLLAVLVLFPAIFGCEDGSGGGNNEISGQVTEITDSGCKLFGLERALETPNNLDCLEYQYDLCMTSFQMQLDGAS